MEREAARDGAEKCRNLRERLVGAVGGRLGPRGGVLNGASYRRPAVVFRAISLFDAHAREYQILHNRAAVNVSGQRLA